MFYQKGGFIILNYTIDIGKKFFIKNKSYETKILFFYRYMSLLGTSIFYLIGDFNDSMKNKLIVTFCIAVSSIILTYLYIKSRNSIKKIMILILVETIGNSFILIPSGGLNSPYIWYALNTVLIASLKLEKKYCWINLLLYLLASTGIVFLIFRGERGRLHDWIHGEINFILSFVLITAAISLLSKLIKKIQVERKNLIETNRRLQLANDQIKQSMDYIMDLYQAVHFFTNQRNKNNLIKLLIDYTKKITKTSTAFFAYYFDEDKKEKVEGEEISETFKKQISHKIFVNWNNIVNMKMPLFMEIEDKKYIIAVVKSTDKIYGMLGIEAVGCSGDIIYRENTEQLRFLSELSSVVLERSDLEEINDRLLISEEQNRIANEIHDGALQKLFSISCGIFALTKNADKMNPKNMIEELNIIRSLTDNIMKELRATIYGLSWKKDRGNTFESYIINYIYQIKKLNHINASFYISGNAELLSIDRKKAFYRIICEAIGNAIRHGNAKTIKVSLDIQDNKSILQIIDDGIGFDVAKIQNDDWGGLGIKNMHYLACFLNGEINIDSIITKGTTIRVMIPNGNQKLSKEEAV